ncbi:hypothetical protein BP5796_12722 [Coleophoma crateriformis]|uniref:Uncharacterized protein n=1 Tax=Coleophoma crateriformis TaxID=565419 RepID=A0A3D8Q631_9HELO|nr:hypothetical protein BP5796_12722 [Coleophoma crateriformis]
MQANRPGEIQFINSSYPGDARSAETQRRARSHASRTGHAKVRRLRVREYQAGKAVPTSGRPEGAQWAEEQVITPVGSVLPTSDKTETEKVVIPSPISLLAADRRDPFHSFAKLFDPVEHFLLDHYVKAVIPYMNTACNKLREPERYVDLMTTEWVWITLTNVGALNGVFLAACRHLSSKPLQQQLYYQQLAFQYKVSCVRSLRKAISAEASSLISDSTVALGILLAYDEAQVGDHLTLQCHRQGLLQMVEHNGGPQTLGANGFLERLISKFTGDMEPVGNFTLKPW